MAKVIFGAVFLAALALVLGLVFWERAPMAAPEAAPDLEESAPEPPATAEPAAGEEAARPPIETAPRLADAEYVRRARSAVRRRLDLPRNVEPFVEMAESRVIVTFPKEATEVVPTGPNAYLARVYLDPETGAVQQFFTGR
ncbi:MAG: hypothetical protein ACFB21_15560 [Opitutales bacterium]